MNLSNRHLFVSTVAILVLVGAGCSERDPAGLEVARATIDPVVFDDDYSEDVYYQAFLGTYADAVKPDSVFAYNSVASLKITVPPRDSALGGYAGGVLTAGGSRDNVDFNALTFYARASISCLLDVAGFGNDNTGTSLYEAGRSSIPLTTSWTFVVIPIPSPSKLIAERGMFTFAERWEGQYPAGHEVWVDEIRFAKLDNVTDPRPVMPTSNKEYFVGSTASLEGTYTRFDVDGADVDVGHLPNYFDFHTSDPAVAIVEGGEVVVIGEGSAVITGTMEDLDVDGAVTLVGYRPPIAAAAAPTVPADRVISMFSDVYRDVPVDTWNTEWTYSTAEVADYVVAGANNKMYSSLNFVGIEFKTQTVDASEMTHLHLDVFAPEGTNFLVKVIAFNGDNGSLIGQAELEFDASTTPAFVAGGWSSLEIPLEDFNLTAPWDHIGQFALSTADARLVLVDNIYWHR